MKTNRRGTIPESSNMQFPNSETIANFKALLKSAMMRARRKGYWFGLSRMERSLYSLALRLQVTLRSIDLIRALVSILRKLKEMGDEGFARLIQGARLAWTYSEVAVAWGNPAARPWRNERNYIIFLGQAFKRNRAP